MRIKEITATRVHYGYRRVHVLLRREGWKDNHKRVYRFYRQLADILWHVRQGMTAHYSVAQVSELVEALNRITDETNRVNRSLSMIAREAREAKVPKISPRNEKGPEAICL